MRRWLLGGTAVGVVVGALGLLVLTSGEAPDAGDVRVPASGGAATLALSPVRSVVTAAQRNATLSYTVGNDSGRERTYTISSAELSAEGLPQPDRAGSAGRWVSPVADHVTVPPHEAVQAKVRLSVPKDRGADERRIGVTFGDSTAARGGSVGVRARITTSVYVEGSGPAVHAARLDGLDLPRFSHGSADISATLVNEGTTTVVPGAPSESIVGTLSRGEPFSLGGAVAAPGAQVRVSGRTGELPFACWCQVRVSAPDGRGGRTTLTGRTLVLPWPQLGLAAGLLGAIVVVGGVRRRRVGSAPVGAPSKHARRPSAHSAPSRHSAGHRAAPSSGRHAAPSRV